MKHVTFNHLLRPLLGVAMVCGPTMAVFAGDVQQISCPCQNGGGGAQYADVAPMDGSLAGGPIISGAPVLSYDSGYGAVSSPPPGTLGQTYHRTSRPIPANKHPRVGMIDVRSSSAAHIIVRWTNDFRTEEFLKGYQDDHEPSLWHFESKPLLPGLSNIHRVEIYHGGPGSAPSDVRYVRLIMGRIVNLTI